MKRLLVVFALAVCAVFPAVADEVTDWDAIMFQASLVPPATSPLVMNRTAAIVQASVFDALNGIERRYSPIHVQPAAPRGASRRAAVVQAAYAALVHLYPAQAATLATQRQLSLDAIASDSAAENSVSIARGIEWGQYVADQIWAWRLTDGFTPAPPPFLGGSNPGEWRPTAPAFLPGAGPQFATMTPFAIQSPSQFRPAGPPALDSARFASDVAEVQSMGSATSTSRGADQTLEAQFWNASTAAYYWHRIALNLSAQHNLTMSQNSRLLALVSVAMGDAAIACWEAKYHYIFWRPITAIRTTIDPTWTPLLITPNFPEYPSGHSTVSGAAGAVIASFFGSDASFTVDSNVMLGVTRSFDSVAAATSEVNDARVFGGIHFRSAVNDGVATGVAVGNYVLQHALLPVNGEE
ncbi:MAG TPA: vanadium-dependent haloperoxidase [Thermoanaerobaculia bacterium]|nr:vanadium-dependent haloperoxidase [Thermoanaerobaculia bacterium]